ncbi:MAG: class II aldolase/adducin family protein [Synechococcus sp.]|nr:class II aldolase/adducin family protein [Synechococcus sp.]
MPAQLSGSVAALRQELVAVARRLNSSGLNQGTSGNLSARMEGGFLITPTSLPFEQMEPEDLVALDFEGNPLPPDPAQPDPVQPDAGQRRPSSEWRLHADLLRCRPEIDAVLHCHSIQATALACHGRGIPPFHYMVVAAGGVDIRCAPYATFGGQELSDHAVAALEGRRACLLAQHGQVTLGRTPEQALRLAVEVEALAHMYLQALQLGEPPRLDAAEMARVLERMDSLQYGLRGA